MALTPISQSIRRAIAGSRLFRRFKNDDSGLSAIEFALLLPLIVMIYLMSVDVTLVVTADRRVTSIASSVGDLVGQSTQLTPAEVNDIFEAGSAILQPMDDTTLSIVVTSVVADEDGVTTVDWSQAHNGSPATAGAAFTLPQGIIRPLESVIVASVGYTYSSPISHFLTGDPWELDEVFYLRPRRTSQVVFNP